MSAAAETIIQSILFLYIERMQVSSLLVVRFRAKRAILNLYMSRMIIVLHVVLL